MLAFHSLLCSFNPARDELRLDGHALFHTEAFKELRDPLLGKDAHQVIFKREVEARGTGIALTAGAPAKLIVDAARLVAFCAKNMEAANGGDFVVLFVGLHLVAVENLSPLVRRHNVLAARIVEKRSCAVLLRT